MKNNALITVLCCLMFLSLFLEISAAEVYGQGYQASGYGPGWAPGMQSDNVYNQRDIYSSAQCSEICQSGSCNVVLDQSYSSRGVPRQVEMLIPVTELVNDIQRIEQTIVTPICEETTLIQRPYSTLESGIEETIQSRECVDDGKGRCVPAIPGSPARPIEVNDTTIWGEAKVQRSNQCHNEVTVTVLPQVIQRNATAYKIVRFTWMDYVNTEVIKKTCTGTPQVSQVTLPPACTYCGPQPYRAVAPSYQAPFQTSQYQKEYQYGLSYEGSNKPQQVRLGRGPMLWPAFASEFG